MGLRRLERIAQQLIEHGMKPDTPAAVIEQGTCPTQRHVLAPLNGIARMAHAAQLNAPALIVIGAVVALAQAGCVTELGAPVSAAM
jgi:siroheme synthase